jgi:hypothetical protein
MECGLPLHAYDSENRATIAVNGYLKSTIPRLSFDAALSKLPSSPDRPENLTPGKSYPLRLNSGITAFRKT